LGLGNVGAKTNIIKLYITTLMCHESMYWSKDHQMELLKQRKKALKERLEKIEQMMRELETEKEKAMASA
jgi:hypothetical protein